MKKTVNALFLAFASVWLLASCGNNAETQQTQQTTEQTEVQTEPTVMQRFMDEVMSVHDEIMPITMKLPDLKENLKVEKAKTKDAKIIGNIDNQIAAIDSAYKAMYDWMDDAGNIQDNLKTLEGEAALKQLEVEKVRIEKVKTDTDKAFEAATAILEPKK